MIFDASSTSASAPSLFFFSFSMFANSLPRSQLIEQSSWQMFNWVPYQGSLAPSWFPLGLRCLLGPSSNRAQLPLDTLLVPHSSASFSFFVCNSLSTPSWHLLVPLSSLWPVPYWVLHTTMAARNQCPRGIRIPMYNWSWSFFYSPLSLSLVCSFFCLFSVALCLLCCWQTVYYFVDKCVFKLDSPREGSGAGARDEGGAKLTRKA